MNFNLSAFSIAALLAGALLNPTYHLLHLNHLINRDYQHGLRVDTVRAIAVNKFDRIVIDSNFTRGYQIKSADLNNDGLPDLVAVSTGMSEIFWYENPSLEKHLLFDQTQDNIDLAPHDIDGDGDIDLAVASSFSLGNSVRGGYVHWLENVNQASSWKLHFIDSIPTSHRLRWADLDGDEMDELINLPIIGRGAMQPNYQEGVEFCYYEIPANSSVDPWRKIIIDSSLHMAHGLQLVLWPDSNTWSILTASFEGVNLFTMNPQDDDQTWIKTKLGEGHTGVKPKIGSSEISLGKLGSQGAHYLSTIEPWHGDQVVVYQSGNSGNLWGRSVIDSSFNDGHALITADLNNDGYDEIIAGHRGRDFNLYFYQFDSQHKKWIRHDLDRGGMSAAGLCLLDFNQDGLLDIAACGSTTHNVVLYVNRGNN